MRSLIVFLIVLILAMSSALAAKLSDVQREQDSIQNVRVISDSRIQHVTEYIYVNMKTIPRKKIEEVVLEARRLTSNGEFPFFEDVLAIIWVESHFRERAYNNGSIGYMQVEEESHPEKIQGRDLNNLYVNLEVGTKVLIQDHRWVGAKGGRKATYSVYNAGIGNFYKGNYKLEYFEKVNSVRQQLRRIR